ERTHAPGAATVCLGSWPSTGHPRKRQGGAPFLRFPPRPTCEPTRGQSLAAAAFVRLQRWIFRAAPFRLRPAGAGLRARLWIREPAADRHTPNYGALGLLGLFRR